METLVIECYDCHEVINVHDSDIIDGYYILCPICGERLFILD